MAGAALVTALGLEFADTDLLAALVRPHDRLDLDLPEAVGVEDGVIRAEQQRLERDLGALVLAHAVDDELIALLDPVLLSAYSNDCVHRKRPLQGRRRSVATPRWSQPSCDRGRHGVHAAADACR